MKKLIALIIILFLTSISFVHAQNVFVSAGVHGNVMRWDTTITSGMQTQMFVNYNLSRDSVTSLHAIGGIKYFSKYNNTDAEIDRAFGVFVGGAIASQHDTWVGGHIGYHIGTDEWEKAVSVKLIPFEWNSWLLSFNGDVGLVGEFFGGSFFVSPGLHVIYNIK